MLCNTSICTKIQYTQPGVPKHFSVTSNRINIPEKIITIRDNVISNESLLRYRCVIKCAEHEKAKAHVWETILTFISPVTYICALGNEILHISATIVRNSMQLIYIILHSFYSHVVVRSTRVHPTGWRAEVPRRGEKEAVVIKFTVFPPPSKRDGPTNPILRWQTDNHIAAALDSTVRDPLIHTIIQYVRYSVYRGVLYSTTQDYAYMLYIYVRVYVRNFWNSFANLIPPVNYLTTT